MVASVAEADAPAGETLRPFVQEAVEPGSSVLTDAWGGYAGLSGLGYDHMVINQSAAPDPAHVLMPAVHRIGALLKRWLLGTYQGAVSREHLNYYLDEFTFRFNRRSSRSRGLLFYRLLEQAAQTQHTPTDALFLATGRWRKANIPLGLVRKQVNDLSCYYSLWRARTNWSVIV